MQSVTIYVPLYDVGVTLLSVRGWFSLYGGVNTVANVTVTSVPVPLISKIGLVNNVFDDVWLSVQI